MEQVVATDFESLKKGFIGAPELPEAWPEWRDRLTAWASAKRRELGEPLYDRDAQTWASRAYAQGFVMLWDNELIDHASGACKVDALLDRAERDFGGYDVLVLWSNYPLSGVDQRHQLAYYDEIPGGRPALAEAVKRCHRRGVRVLLDHKPWVEGTPEGFATVEDAFVALARECGLDGFFLDCSDGPDDSFRETLARECGPDKIFISEAPARLRPFGHEIGSWQQMTDDTAAPGTYRNRWLDRCHMVYESRRCFHDPIRELQRAWMNGGGFVVWENIFGYWASYSARCKSWMRLMFPAQRHLADFFVRGVWRPHVGGAAVSGVYVSEWTLGGRTLWTAVNRRGHTIEKKLFILPAHSGFRYFDVISGAEYSVAGYEGGNIFLSGCLERDGLAGVLAVPELDSKLEVFLHAQRQRFAAADWTARPWDGEHRKTELQHVLLRPPEAGSAVPETALENQKGEKSGEGIVPAGMARISDFDGWMISRYRMRECGYIAGTADELHVYDAFEKTCRYSRKAVVQNVAIDLFPVTNADYLHFLEASGYSPRDSRNFLKHWLDGKPRPGQERHPVVYVCLQDARAYAAWAGKRLPFEEEWQAAAHNPCRGEWPWGTEPPEGRCNSASGGTTQVDAFPLGRSHCGAWDMSGNVWEMTESERSDGHTRYQILKGGCWYRADNSSWLFDTGARPADWGAKHILLCPAWDRCATIGFRCVADLK